jgi:hypothetical protein
VRIHGGGFCHSANYPLFGVASKYCLFPPADLLTLQRGHPDSDQELMTFWPFDSTRARVVLSILKEVLNILIANQKV